MSLVCHLTVQYPVAKPWFVSLDYIESDLNTGTIHCKTWQREQQPLKRLELLWREWREDNSKH